MEFFPLILDSLTQPARLPPFGAMGEEGVTQGFIWNIRRDIPLGLQLDDIMLDKDTRGGIMEGEGEALAIWGFQDEMRLKLRGVFPGNSDHPPEFVSDPRGIQGHG